MNSIKNLLPTECLKSIYNSLFNSHLTYGVLLWGPNSLASSRDRIIKLQKRAVRIVNKSPYNAHTGDIFKKLNILKLPDVIDLEILKLMYLYGAKALPAPILNFFTANRHMHNYNTRNRDGARVIAHNYAPLKNSFLIKGPSMWASVCYETKQKPSLNSFVKAVKQDKLSSY